MRNPLIFVLVLAFTLLQPLSPARASTMLTPADMEAMMRTMMAMIRMWNTMQNGGGANLSWNGWPDLGWGSGGAPLGGGVPWGGGMPGGPSSWGMPAPGGWSAPPWGGTPPGGWMPRRPGQYAPPPVTPLQLRGLWRGEDGTWLYFERDLFALRTPSGNETLGRFSLSPGALHLQGVTGGSRRLALRLNDGYMELWSEEGQSQRFLRVWPRRAGGPENGGASGRW